MTTSGFAQRIVQSMSAEQRRVLLAHHGAVVRAYVHYWEVRPEKAGAHRDTLPAFLAGYDAALMELAEFAVMISAVDV